MNENNEVQYLKPFKRFCMSIGELPTSYLETMSYYEMLVWLTKYLGEQVIPTVNNNGEVVSELQSFVENYFDNLDVQEEINTKLDEMATDGTLENIINQEIFGEINSEIETIESDIVVAIGDSYSVNNTGWGSLLGTYLGKTTNVDYFFKGEGASGLTSTGHAGHTFLDLLNSANTDIPSDDKVKVKKVIMLGFYNDINSSSSDITTAFSTFNSRVKTLFPNAKLYVGCIAGNNAITNDGTTSRNKIIANCNLMKKLCLDYQAIYLTNSELVLKNYTTYDSTNFHPNLEGCQNIAKMVVSNLNGCSYKFPYSRSLVQVSDTKSITSAIVQNFGYENINENNYQLIGTQDITYSSNQTVSVSQGLYLGTISNQKYLRPINDQYLQRFNATAQITTGGTSYAIGGYILINNTGEYYFYANRSYGEVTYIHVAVTLNCPAQYC